MPLRRAHTRTNPRTGQPVPVRPHNVGSNTTAPRDARTGQELANQAAFAAAIQHWTINPDRTHPAVQPLLDRLRSNPTPAPTLYRGFVTLPGYPQLADLEEGADLVLPMVSCSESEQVAQEFTWSDTLDENDPNLASVTMTIHDAQGLCISADSEFEWQQEWVIEGQVRVDRVERTQLPGFAAPEVNIEATWLPPT